MNNNNVVTKCIGKDDINIIRNINFNNHNIPLLILAAEMHNNSKIVNFLKTYNDDVTDIEYKYINNICSSNGDNVNKLIQNEHIIYKLIHSSFCNKFHNSIYHNWKGGCHLNSLTFINSAAKIGNLQIVKYLLKIIPKKQIKICIDNALEGATCFDQLNIIEYIVTNYPDDYDLNCASCQNKMIILSILTTNISDHGLIKGFIFALGQDLDMAITFFLNKCSDQILINVLFELAQKNLYFNIEGINKIIAKVGINCYSEIENDTFYKYVLTNKCNSNIVNLTKLFI